MRITSIKNPHNNQNIYFGVKPKPQKRKNTDNTVTLRDLKEMETRINKNNERLIQSLALQLTNKNQELTQNQNDMIGTVLEDMSKQIFMRNTASAKDLYQKTKHDSEILKNSGFISI